MESFWEGVISCFLVGITILLFKCSVWTQTDVLRLDPLLLAVHQSGELEKLLVKEGLIPEFVPTEEGSTGEGPKGG